MRVIGVVDDAFPGWVEFHIEEASGRRHRGVEKAPVIGVEGALPTDAWIACHVVGTRGLDGGRRGLEVDISSWGLATDDGETHFVVEASQVEQRMP